jgi:AcrR family transcriptional regulator
MPTDTTPKPPRRRYYAPIRQAHAKLTRQRILEAGAQVFRERGYGAASMEAIAARAEVSVPTLYVTFGGKPQLLASLILGLKEETRVYESVRELMACSDPVALLQQGAAVAVRFNAVGWELLDVLRAGSKAQSELASLWDQVEGARFRDQELIVRRFAQEGMLRPDLSVPQAAAIFWALTAHDQYRLLVVESGWGAEAFEAWLSEALCDQLLRSGLRVHRTS